MFNVKWVWQNLKGRQFIFIVATILTVIASIITIINPYISSIIVDKVIIAQSKQLLIPLLLLMGAVQILRLSLRYILVVFFENCSQHTIVKIKTFLYDKLQAQDMYFYDKYHTGELMTRLTGDIDMIRHTIAFTFFHIVEAIIIFLSALIFFFTINVPFTLSLLSLAPVILIVSYTFSKRVKPLFQNLRQRMTELNRCAQEAITGNKVIKAFAREEYQEKIFNEKNDGFRQARLKATFTWLRYFPYIESLSHLTSVLALFVGGIFIINGKLTFGELSAFTTLSWAISNPMRQLGPLLNDLQRFSVSVERIIEIYYSKPSIVDKKNAIEKKIKGKITFQNVSFSFGNEKVLDNISFEILPGQTLAIMGPTGSGKTTIFNLIARLYDVDSGRVLVDDIDVRDYKLSTLRSSIGMATQDVFLFSDSIDGNIAYGDPEMSEENVIYFAEVADACGFIEQMADRYNTLIGERGVGLSGGQRQRIALARALAIRPPIIMLDDTTSAVDAETEQYIREQLENLDFSCTKLIVAQRIASVKNADKIIVLENGKIIESGTHDELLSKKGYYYDIYTLQAGSVPQQDQKAGDTNGPQ